ncbi:hypothetical protein CHRYSEOSP005_15040 [Chryseobacterium sp. Alg-005]|uniref:glycoside hydrolase family 19 protein n=1 Tax=Chryseobacterium sp. Alg-005 TaxID=3159516 RepID=UPI00355594A6
MINRKKFFDGYKNSLDSNKKLDQTEVDAITVFLDFVDATWKTFTIPQWAYVFATTLHETDATFLPIKEAYWLSEEWRRKNLRYFPYYGRGYVQITWKENYKKFSEDIGEDFVENPDLVMIPKYAFKILVDGFKNGAFTGKKISHYINNNVKDYKGARRCINGTDKKDLIASYAETFERILTN